jgi:hypothetical protein
MEQKKDASEIQRERLIRDGVPVLQIYASFSYFNRLHLRHRINLVFIAFIRLNRHQDRHLLDHCPKFHFDLHPHRHKDHYNPP